MRAALLSPGLAQFAQAGIKILQRPFNCANPSRVLLLLCVSRHKVPCCFGDVFKTYQPIFGYQHKTLKRQFIPVRAYQFHRHAKRFVYGKCGLCHGPMIPRSGQLKMNARKVSDLLLTRLRRRSSGFLCAGRALFWGHGFKGALAPDLAPNLSALPAHFAHDR